MKRKAHVLKAGKGGRPPRYRVYCDSESRVIALEHKPWLMCACFFDSRYKKRHWRDYLFDEITNFWVEVANYGEDKKSSVTIYGHNIMYDLIATGGIPVLLKEGFHVTNFFEKGLTFILQMRKTRKYHNRKGEEKEAVIKTLNFVSTTNYYVDTLKRIGDAFSLEKLEYDYNQGKIKEGITYCRRDVEICMTAMETFIDFITENNLGPLAKTAPGQSFNAYRARFMPVPLYLHDHNLSFSLERNAYYGGRVECWRIGEFYAPEKFYGYDINSMYPHVMKNNHYPVKLVSYRKRNSLADIQSCLAGGQLIIGQFIINTNRPYFPVNLKGNLIFPVGRFKTYLSTPEIQFAIERGLIEDIGECAIYEAADIFSEYVNYFYQKRLEAKQKKDRIHDLLYKLFLNSLYGKFGQKTENWQRIGDAPPEQIKAETIINLATGKAESYKIFGGSVFKKGEETEAFNSFCAIAAHVTAYARQELLRYIELAGWENILYMDTDSLFVTKAGSANLQAAGVVDAKELGKMKLEKEAERIKILAPKDYEFAGVKRTKGIKKDSKRLDDHERKYEVEIWPRLNTFIREGNLSSYKNIKRIKVLSGDYNKGWVTSTGEVLPLEMDFDGDNYILPWHYSKMSENYNLLDSGQETKIYKRYRGNYYVPPEIEYQQELIREREKLRKEIRRAVMKLGGVNDPDYEYIPRWAKRKAGSRLDELVAELQEQGYYVADADELYELIITN